MADVSCIKLKAANVVLMGVESTSYLWAVNTLYDCSNHNREALGPDNSDGATPPPINCNGDWVDCFVDLKFPQERDLKVPEEASHSTERAYSGGITFIDGPDIYEPRASSTEYWKGLRSHYSELQSICLVIHPSETAACKLSHYGRWENWYTEFYLKKLDKLLGEQVDFYFVDSSSPHLIRNFQKSIMSNLRRGVRTFCITDYECGRRFLKTLLVDLPLHRNDVGDHGEHSKSAEDETTSYSEGSKLSSSPSTLTDPSISNDTDTEYSPILDLGTARLSDIHKYLVISALDISEVLYGQICATEDLHKAVEGSVREAEERTISFRIALQEAMEEKKFLVSPKELEAIADVHQTYVSDFEFDIEAKFPIRDFEMISSETLISWDPTMPPTIDPCNPRRFTGRIRDKYPFSKSTCRLRLFGYRSEIHEEEITNLEERIKKLEHNLQDSIQSLDSLLTEYVRLGEELKRHDEMLADCCTDLGLLSRPDQLDWDFSKMRKYLRGCSAHGVSRTYRLKSRIPKNVSRSSEQKIGIDTAGDQSLSLRLFEQLYGASLDLHKYLERDVLTTIRNFKTNIDQTIDSTETILSEICSEFDTKVTSDDTDEGSKDAHTQPDIKSFLPQTSEGKKQLKQLNQLAQKVLTLEKDLNDKARTLKISYNELGEDIRMTLSSCETIFDETITLSQHTQNELSTDIAAFEKVCLIGKREYSEVGLWASSLQHNSSFEAMASVFEGFWIEKHNITEGNKSTE